jgi:hypothetical protein
MGPRTKYDYYFCYDYYPSSFIMSTNNPDGPSKHILLAKQREREAVRVLPSLLVGIQYQNPHSPA